MQEFYGITTVSTVDAVSIAAANSLFREMKLLLADGVDVDAIASYCGGTALHAAAGYGLIRSLDFLIRAGADLNATDRMHLTPLMSACSRGKLKGSRVAMRLIEAGANVRYVRTSDEMTALKFAVHTCSPEVIQALIDHGADVDGRPGTDLTALMIAARSHNVEALKVLVKNGAVESRRCELSWADGRTAEGLVELEGQRAALDFFRQVRAGSPPQELPRGMMR
jgi:ankyrin repeat protein